MTLRKFNYLLELTRSIGIKTLGDLAEYRKKKGIRSNNELFIALYSDKCGKKCAVMDAYRK